MSKTTTPRHLIKTEPRKLTLRLQADLALRDLPVEEPFPPVHPQWKTYAAFQRVNALAAGRHELWAATWGGVVRWWFADPGNRIAFTRFAGEHGLPGHRFHCLAVDRYGRPWAGGPEVGLCTFAGERWRIFTTDDGLPSNDIHCLAQGPDDRLWVGTGKGVGYIVCSDEALPWQDQSLEALDLPAADIRAIAVETGSTVWLGTDWGLYRLGPEGAARRYTVAEGLPGLQITALALDGQARLWVGTAEGLCCLEAGQLVSCEVPDGPILGLTADPTGMLWLVTAAGIGLYTSDGLVEIIDPHPALAEKAQGRAVAVSTAGRRWFGYTTGVVQQIPPRVLVSGVDPDQMSNGENSLDNCITAIEVDATGRMWVGTPTGIAYLERNVWCRCEPGVELATALANIRAIVFSSLMERLWVGGWPVDDSVPGMGGGLRQFIGTVDVPLSTAETPDISYVDALTADAKGRLWAASEGVIHRYDGEQWMQWPPLPDEATGEVIQTLAVNDRDVVWCGTTNGLWRYDKKWRKEKLEEPVQTLACARAEVWAGTPAGLKRLAGREWLAVEGAPQTAVNALLVDPAGVVWAGTRAGLARVAAEGCRLFTAKQDGLAHDFVQCLAWANKTLWIGTANGLSRFTLPENETGDLQ